MSALVASDLADSIATEDMASILDRLASGARVNRVQLLEALQAVRADPKGVSGNLTLQNAASFIEALADQTDWLSSKATLAQCRWFASELRTRIS